LARVVKIRSRGIVVSPAKHEQLSGYWHDRMQPSVKSTQGLAT
jgi:hypothetical protein